MPRWWINEPGISLGMVDTPLFYSLSSGQEMAFTFYYNQRAGLPAPDETPISSTNIQATGTQYQQGPNCGSQAFWGYDWNMSVVIKPIQSQTDLTFAGGYYAMVFYPDGTEELYTNCPLAVTKNPRTQVILTDNSGGAGYPKVAAEDTSPYDGLSTNMPTADTNGFYWGDPNVGVKLVYPDGSQDVFALSGCVIGTRFPLKPTTNYVSRLLLTQRIDAAGRVTQLGYEYYHDPAYIWMYRIKYVVDPDFRTNTFFYTATNNAQLSEIDDPYGRKTTLKYSNGMVTQIVDAIGLTNSFQYVPTQVIPTTYYVSDGSDAVAGVTYSNVVSSGWITQLATKYGTNRFVYYEMDDASGVDAVQQRAIFVSGPEGAQELYYYLHKNDSLPRSAAVTPTVPGITNFDDGIAGGISGHNALFYRNTFHWGPRQFAALAAGNYSAGNGLLNALSYQIVDPNYSQNQFASALSALGTNDFNKAGMKHWLWGSDNYSLSSSVSSEQAPSFDAAGQIPGARTWYNYTGKPDSGAEDIGGNPQIACLAKVLPDGSSQYSTYHFYPQNAPAAGLVSDNEFTYTKPDGSVGLLTNWFGYATSGIDLVSISNSAGQYVNYGYANHQIIAITNALGQPASFNWDPATHNLTGIQMASGQAVSLGYYPAADSPTNTSAMLQWATIQPQGRAFTNNSYSAGLPTSVTDDRGVTTTSTFDKLNRLTSTVYPDNTSVSNVYTRLDLTATKDRLGNWSYFAYDGLQHLTNSINANGATNRYLYCACGALNEIIDTLGNPTYFNYDNQGNLTNVQYPDFSSLTYTLDALGRVTNVVDGAQRFLNMAYNIQGLVTNVSNAHGPLKSIIYDALGRPAIFTDAHSVTVTNTFDALNELVQRTWADGVSEGYGYSAQGLVVYTNRDGKATWYNRDNAGRTLGETNANLEITRLAYDSLGNVTDLWDGNTNHTQWRYNEYGWLTNKTDGLNRAAFRYLYNPNGWVTNRWTPEKGNTAYLYDNFGNLKTVNYPLSTINYNYDALNRLTNMVDALGNHNFGWTPTGSLASESDSWTTVSFTNLNGLRMAMSIQQSGGNWMQTYAYDASWRLTNTASPAGTFTYQYQSSVFNLPSCITLPNGAKIVNSYDPLARLTGTALNNYWGHTLDGYGYTSDALGLHTNIVRNFGLATSTVTAGFDNIGQLTSWSATEAGGTPRQNEQLGFSYDAAHNLHTRNNGNLAQTFTTDAANQLNNVTRTGTFTYVGAIPAPATSVTVNGQTAQSYGDFSFAVTNFSLANGSNTFTTIAQNAYGLRATNAAIVILPSSVNLGFDNNGNLTNDGLRSFAYDSENQLTNITLAGQWKSDLVYDGLNRRRIARDFVWQSGAWILTNETHYIYDGRLLVQERDTNNNARVTYTRGLDLDGALQSAGGIGGLLARTDSNASTFYHANGIGNVTALIDAQENIVARYLYNPFGKLMGQWGALASANTLQYSSKPSYRDLNDFGFRWYVPELDRWLTRDPLGDFGFQVLVFRRSSPANIPLEAIDSPNIYAFVVNNPLGEIDPLGLLPPSNPTCKALKRKIDNLEKEIRDRTRELYEDPLGLPGKAAGDDAKPSLSKRGHQKILNMMKANLAAKKALYQANCSDPEPPKSCPMIQPMFAGQPVSPGQGALGLGGAALLLAPAADPVILPALAPALAAP